MSKPMQAAFYDRFIRDLRLKKFYQGEQWRKVRAIKLDRSPLCEPCAQAGVTKAAALVHHMLPVKDHWDRRLDLDFMVSVCHQCHNSIESEMEAAK